jgi:hypothetical protein
VCVHCVQSKKQNNKLNILKKKTKQIHKNIKRTKKEVEKNNLRVLPQHFIIEQCCNTFHRLLIRKKEKKSGSIMVLKIVMVEQEWKMEKNHKIDETNNKNK